ncbi:condensation domain-containing protein [Kitasatospora terrestris]|uniref:Condensation domain-containing protein n=1 Tax=Kitasatospora terrestris TaxID=258051 RepID=A0ABP9DIL2_9ACTN
MMKAKFEGATGTGAPTWGQQLFWSHLRAADPPDQWNLSAQWPLAEPVAVADVVELLGDLVGSQPALRTSFAIDGDQLQAQNIIGSGHVDVLLTDVNGTADPEPTAEAVRVALKALPFDLESGPLARFGVVTDGPIALTVVIACSHLVLDWWAFHHLLRDEFYTRVAAWPAGRAGPVDLASIERAELESTRRYRIKSRTAIERWRTISSAYPSSSDIWRPDATGPELSVVSVVLRSSALAFAEHTVARSIGLFAGGSLLLSAAAEFVCEAERRDRTAFRVAVCNRFSAKDRQYAGILNQYSLVGVESGRSGFVETARQTDQALLAAVHSGGLYDPAELEALESERLRDGHATTYSYDFNDTRIGVARRRAPCVLDRVGPADLTWEEPRRRPAAVLFTLSVWDEEDATCVGAAVDTTWASPQRVARWLADTELRILNAARACEPAS